jgi:hypothetical protein
MCTSSPVAYILVVVMRTHRRNGDYMPPQQKVVEQAAMLTFKPLLRRRRVGVGADLANAALRVIVNEDQAEALAVALGPLEVVQEGPDEVALDGHTLATV